MRRILCSRATPRQCQLQVIMVCVTGVTIDAVTHRWPRLVGVYVSAVLADKSFRIEDDVGHIRPQAEAQQKKIK